MGGVTPPPPTFGIFIGKFNSVEFRRYMADVLSQAVFKCVEIALYSINTCDTDRLEHFQHRNIHIDVAISKARKQQLSMENQERLRNRKVIKLLLDCSRYLARQSLTFRGGDDAEGNFAQLVRLLARWSPFIDYWLTSSHSRPYQVTYMSAMSQNEFIGLLGDEVCKILISEVISSGAYAVMADTTPDISHADQISLVIRYVNDNLENQREAHENIAN